MINLVQNQTITQIFGKDSNAKEQFYEVPPYQREYAWGIKEIEELFNDIDENSSGYFIGSIICLKSGNSVDVIDGQQRLITVSLLLLAIYSVLSEKIKDGEIQLNNNKKYRKLYDSIEELICMDGKSRVVPSVQNEEDYFYLLCANGIECDKCIKYDSQPKHFTSRRVFKNFDKFKKLIDNFETIDEIYQFLEKVKSLILVKIDVENTASAFTLFESINNRGIPLTPIDLIKNSIIGQLSTVNHNPQGINDKWQKIVENVEGYQDQVRFLRHFYHAFACSEPRVKISGYAKISKKQIIDVYDSLIKRDALFILEELIDKSNIYNNFIEPEGKHHKYEKDLIELKRIGVAPSYALLLYLFSKYEEFDLSKILKFFQSWFIRRNLSDFPGTNKLDQIFVDLINKISCQQNDEVITSEDDLCKIIKSFLTDSKRYLDDDKFKEVLMEKDIYDISENTTRVLLIKLEMSKRMPERTEEDGDDNFWKVGNGKKRKMVWEVEHIYPQRPKKGAWNIDLGDYVHRLGNLTLTRYNRTLSNDSFENKCNAKDRKGNAIGLKSGKVKINDFILGVTQWTDKEIEKRGEILADEILKILNTGC